MRASVCASPGKAEGGTGRPPPRNKKLGGEGRGAQKQPTATKPPANTTRGGQTPHLEGTQDWTPKEAQGDHPAETSSTKPGTAAHRKKGHLNMQTHTTKKKKSASSPARKKGNGGTGTPRPGTATPSNRHHKAKPRKKKAQKTHPDNSAKNGGAQPRPGPSTQAHTAHRNRKRRGSSGARRKPHTSHKQAET